ncbi:MAG: ATP-dependent metallopeptidase FtsH/Yme1/Tma family protein [Planctomycetota bacterium]|nr:MAG: ATP-dependent metallopeptidase FtsH/Yme1/Tma family protein [Planctomycetota bacterium]
MPAHDRSEDRLPEPERPEDNHKGDRDKPVVRRWNRRLRRFEDEPQPEPTPPSLGPFFFLMVVLAALAAVWLFQSMRGYPGTRVSYSFFWKQLEAGNVAQVRFRGDVLIGRWKRIPESEKPGVKLEAEFHTVLPPTAVRDQALMEMLRKQGVEQDADLVERSVGPDVLLWLLGFPLMLLLLWFFMRRAADPLGGGMLGNFMRSPAKRFEPSEQKTTFDDVAGMEQAKLELREVVEFLKHPERFQRLGAHIPKGVLLVGPPGTGKTLLARATAGEAGVPFFSVSGSEFIQMFVGVGAGRVRDLFNTAKENAPCLIFIDEIDAVGRMRGAGLGGGHDEREQTLNQILSEMDGFEKHDTVIVLAATNRPDVLDPALLRPGRFDRHITIDRPNRAGRLGILRVHCRNVPLDDSVDLEEIAASTIGFSGADLQNLVNEAALHAARLNKKVVDREDFEYARDRVLMGPAREDILTDEEKERTAYHEAGHALLAWVLPHTDPIHKVTIVPRGRALGVTQLVPDEERFHIGERQLRDQLTMMLGGRAAEKVVYDEYSAGAEDDLRRCTDLARKMVAHWGMSEVVGPVTFSQVQENPFLGKELHEIREFSDETAHMIDREVQRLLSQASERAFRILTERRDDLERLVRALLEKEELSRSDLEALFGAPVQA